MPELPFHVPLNRHRTPCADKNDRLGWNHGLAVRWSGVTIGLRCNRPEVLPAMQAALPPGSEPCAERDSDLLLSVLQGGEAGRGRRNYHIVYNGWERVARTLDWDEALFAFRESLRSHSAFLAREHTLLDCRVVELGGRPVTFCPGPPHSEERVDLRHCPRLVLVADERSGQFSDRLPPGQVALELLRFAVPTWTQPQRVVSEIAACASEIRLYRVPADLSGGRYDAFIRSLPRE